MRFSTYVLLLTLLVVSPAGAQTPPAVPTPTPESVPTPSASEFSMEFAPPVSDTVTEYPVETGPYGSPSFEMCEIEPLDFESTGTWLRRGWWYAEADAVVMNRFWNRDNYILAGDNIALATNGGAGRALRLRGKAPGAEGSVRLAIGRFLFRDEHNRDHQVEFNAFGGGEWVDECNVASATPNGLSVDFPWSRGNPTFTQASTMNISYASRFQSYELNYRVRGRMKRDRMELDPSGRWTRVAHPQVTTHYLAGLRLFELDEELDWTAGGITAAANANGLYTVDTSNLLIGPQIGGGLVFERDRWSVEFGGKAGVYMNSIDASNQFFVSNTPATAFTSRADEFTLSFVGEYTMVARWHLRPNVSLRAGWEMLYVTSTALAAQNITFAPFGGKLAYTGDPFYHGAIFGLEGFW